MASLVLICFWMVINRKIEKKTVSSSHQASGGHPGTQGPGEGVHPVALPSHPGPAPPAVCRHRRYARLSGAPVGPPRYTDEHDAPGFTDYCIFWACLLCAGSASAVEMEALLVQTGLFDSALTLCQTFKLSLTPVFEGLTYK